MKTSDPNVLIKHLGKVAQDKIKKIRYATEANAQELARNAKAGAPKDLAKLAQGIQVFEDTLKDNVGVSYRVVATEPYSAYVEFGTGSRVEVPPGLEDWAMQFYVNGEGQTPAKPYLYPAFLEQKQKYLNDLQAILDA